ncbi:hypothetical protein [Streptomyces sp. MUSC 14]|uniref:hypothetical protein n=1 Tax=Streptomyces sp. MUSC 14 TaxID=1354889 RepID=UPI000A762A60|nr:hypothetical protein [Streptomyces sp. MUSC 14]
MLQARAVAYEAVFVALDELDCGGDVNVSGVDVGWVVMESGEDGSPTGHPLSGLHEDLLTMDPSGHDGADLWLQVTQPGWAGSACKVGRQAVSVEQPPWNPRSRVCCCGYGGPNRG